jgi:hypothetical protein
MQASSKSGKAAICQGRNVPRKFSDKEIAEFIDEHLAHRLTVLLCVAKRSEQSDFWQGRGDVYRASLEGSFIHVSVLIEFLGSSHTEKATGSTI